MSWIPFHRRFGIFFQRDTCISLFHFTEDLEIFFSREYSFLSSFHFHRRHWNFSLREIVGFHFHRRFWKFSLRENIHFIQDFGNFLFSFHSIFTEDFGNFLCERQFDPFIFHPGIRDWNPRLDPGPQGPWALSPFLYILNLTI